MTKLQMLIELIVLVGLTVIWTGDGNDKPNVIFFMTDDWGFNDVSYHSNTDTATPFIDSMALDESLIIGKYYAYPVCTVTRAALLTGRYAMRSGMQDEVILMESNYALPKRETLIAEEFQEQGYSTHIIGKWHLGMMGWDYTPTYRGFDSFLGYYGGALYYYTHYGKDSYVKGYDMRWNEDEYNTSSDYSLNIWSEHANNLIDNIADAHDNPDKEVDPFFLYFAWQGSHSPSEAEDEYMALYTENLNDSTISEQQARLAFQAQTTMTDDLFETFVDKLHSRNLWDNTLIVFCSDNGGKSGFGDNSPLRGAKTTLWEGGIRVPAFITGGYLPSHLRGKLFDSYPIHVTDWYPSLLHAASGVDTSELKTQNELDGKNVWKLLMTATKSSRESFSSALTSDNQGMNDDYIEKGGLDAVRDIGDMYEGSIDELMSISDERTMLINVVGSNKCKKDVCGALIYGGRWKIMYGNVGISDSCDWDRSMQTSSNDILGCGVVPSDVDSESCVCESQVCLFDLLNDPCEYYDVSEEHAELTSQLYTQLEEYFNVQVLPLYDVMGVVNFSLVDPTNEDGSIGFWKPWINQEWYELEFEISLDGVYQHVQVPEMYMQVDDDHHDSFTGYSLNFNYKMDMVVITIGLILIVILIRIIYVYHARFSDLNKFNEITPLLVNLSDKINYSYTLQMNT